MFCKSEFINVIENNKPENLESIHLIIWDNVPHYNLIKNNLRRFEGFATAETNLKTDFICKSFSKEELKKVCTLLNIDFNDEPKKMSLKIVEKLTSPVKNIQKSISTKGVDNKSVLSTTSRKSEKVTICKQIEKIDEQYLELLELLETVCAHEEKLENENFRNNPSNEVEVRHMQRQIRILNAKLSSIESKKKTLLAQQEEEDNISEDSDKKSIYTKQWVNKCEEEIPEEAHSENISFKSAAGENEINELKTAMASMIVRQSTGLKLPDFSGTSSIAWNNFMMQYRITSKQCQVSDEENVLRLNQHLKGEAREKVDLLLISSKTPEPIINILQNHYGGDEKVLKELITKSEKVNYVDSLSKFAEFNYTVQNVSSAVNQINSDLYDIQKLLALFIEKLPQHIVMQWASHLLSMNINCKNVKFEYFAKWIQSLSGVVSDVTFFTTINGQRKTVFDENTTFQQGVKKKIETTSDNWDSMKSCKICKVGEHSIEKCSEFLKQAYKKRWDLVKKNNLCFCCLKSHRGQCKKRVQCKISSCDKFHHELLHKTENQINKEFVEVAAENDGKESQVLLKMVPVQVKGPKGVLVITALLDEGSTLTLIDKSISDSIGAHGEKSPLCFRWTGGIFRSEPDCESIELNICSERGNTFNQLKNVKTVCNLDLPDQPFDYKAMLKKYPQLKKFNLCHQREKPLLLIGQNNAKMIVSREIMELEENGPIVTKTLLGWALHGPDVQTSEKVTHFTCCQVSEDKLEQLINNHFELENFGVSRGNEENPCSNDKAVKVAEESIRKIGNQYEVALPWKTDTPTLQDSKPMAFQRFYCIEKKLQKDEQLRKAYIDQINKLLDKGYARKIKFSELKDKRTWFLPHFAVTNPKKPHKQPRIVFDAAAKVNNVSLNDQLLPGPDWLSSIIGILIRFREKSIAFAGDICEMFNRVNIADKDTFSQCFLWRDSPNQPIEVYQMKAMLFGLNCSPFLAQFVKNFNARQYKDSHPDAYEAIVRNHYVDDYLDSAETEAESIDLIKKVIDIHSRGGFQIRAFISNSQEVIKNLPKHLVDEKMFTTIDKSNIQKVLGISWIASSDCFKFIFNMHRVNRDILDNFQIPTKRDVLKAVMSVYDPLGLLTPVTIKGRLLMKDVWKSQIGWDDIIPESSKSTWINWLRELKSVSEIEIPRCYNTSIKHPEEVELHVFNDASLQAFCSSAYFRFTDGKTYNTSLILAKAKVVPESRRSTTIPKLELIAAVMGMRLAKTILKETRIKISKTVYWTDSIVVLSWIKNNKILKPFEAVRVNEILENTSVEQWRWIPTNLNVADLGTKIRREDLVNSKWFTGPDFLTHCDESWIIQKPVVEDYTEVSLLLVENVSTTHDHLPKPERFSKLNRLIRSTAWIYRFITNCKNSKNGEIIKGFLKIEEIEWAMVQWIQIVQEDCYSEDLKKAKNLSYNNSKLLLSNQMTSIDSNNILRISGRIDRARGVIPETKQPYILDGHHYFTKLLVMKIHEDFNHFGTQIVINQFRRKYFMPKMVRRIKSIIHGCIFCQVKNCKPLQPEMGKLPDVRFYTYQKAFTATGIDYFGPFYVKHGRKVEARYGVLFTCMTTRAIHVEIAHSLNTDSCIMAVRRMMSLHGQIKEMLSDNGTNFHGANRELLEALEELDVTNLAEELVKYKIDWKFNPPLAPNFGGCWERLIGCFKKSLEHVLSVNRNPTDEMLQTIFREAQYIINSRPYIIESNDQNDDVQQTPNDLLIPHNITLHPFGNFENDSLSKQKWRIAEHLIDSFWNYFTKSYIPTLLERKKWTKSVKNLVEGDIIKVRDNLPRGQWPLGKVEKVFPGEDGVVRAVDVRIGNKTFRRAVNKLCRIDVAEGWRM